MATQGDPEDYLGVDLALVQGDTDQDLVEESGTLRQSTPLASEDLEEPSEPANKKQRTEETGEKNEPCCPPWLECQNKPKMPSAHGLDPKRRVLMTVQAGSFRDKHPMAGQSFVVSVANLEATMCEKCAEHMLVDDLEYWEE